MPPGSSPSGGFRESLKRRARRVKELFGTEDQAPNSRIPSPQPQPPDGALPPQPTPTQQIFQQPSAQTQQSALLPPPVPSAGGSTSTAGLVAADSVQSSNAESALAQAAKKAGADAWNGLKATLRLVEKSSDVFPPLKSAVAGFLGVVDIFETAAQNRKDYEALALHLESMVLDFKEHPEERTSSGMSEALRAMSSALDKELEHVIEQRRRSGFRSHLEAGQDVGDVQECRRRVEILCRELQNKAALKTWTIVEEQQVRARLKELNAVPQATYDSSFSNVVGRRTCTPGTRKAILTGMREWADNPDGPKVYWLNGMAGTGKTTLAYSFCAEMKLAGRLGASFFCSRNDQGSKDVSRIVPTIAYQLARLSPSYREVLVRHIGEDEDIGTRKTETQFEKLIRDPLLEVRASMPEGIVVTIDALDECDRRNDAQDVLNALLLHAQDLPIKFLVTCRPEPGLYDVLQAESGHRRTSLALHDIKASFVQADIRIYLEAELGTISLSEGKLGQLVEQAGTLFIYAATAVRYIHPKGRQVNSRERLEQLLSITSASKSNKHKDIDDLYRAVLRAPFTNDDLEPKEQENVRLVLDTAICSKEPMSVAAMAGLLQLDREEVMYALQHLRSVLHVSQDASLISTLHASFPDFMLDLERSKDLCCHAAKHHLHLSLRCFSTMQRLLRFNICELTSSFDLDESIPDLAKKIQKAILPELLYACCYWADHLVSAEALDDVRCVLEGFLSERLLFWMEVLNLNRCIHIGARGLYQVQAWTQRTNCPIEMQQLARDAVGFVTMFLSNPVSRSTPHIYISALPFWPEQRPVSIHYLRKMKGIPKATGTGMRRREAAPLAISVTPGRVFSVAYSSDGARIVSGSYDKTICIWDAHTGKMIGEPLEGHVGGIWSVAFASDGARIVSGSEDNTIRIWDAHTGEMIGEPLKGHTSTVYSVAFSPDGARIISGSLDTTIRVWNAHTGKMIGEPLEGHTSTVRSVAFSSDGARIVSASHDHTVRIWDAYTGEMIGKPLEGHTDQVNSAAFSPDSARIISGSDDNTIRIWDAHTGKMVGEPLEGHTGTVYSVAFSSDGMRIVSGSYDNTIRIRDAHTSEMIGEPLEGHIRMVYSVAFSSDNARIVSGSGDRTIRIWDAHASKMVGEPLEGHTGAVSSVAFSFDGAHIVSGSLDATIRVWDAHTGKMIGEPLEGHFGPVKLAVFSSDGARVASGSDDNAILVWNAHTGEIIGEPLEGHTSTVYSVAFSSDGTRIISGSADNTIRIWDAHTGKMIGEPLEGHINAVQSVAYSSDDTRIVSGSHDHTIRIWDAHTGEMIGKPLEGHDGRANSVAFSSDGMRIISGSDDNTIRIWDAHTGQMIGKPLRGHFKGVTSAAFSSDNARIVSGSYDNTIRIWDAHTGQMIGKPLRGHTDQVNSVTFSPDGTRIVSGSDDETIRIWDAHTGRMVGELLEGHIDEIESVAYFSSDTHIVSSLPNDAMRMTSFKHISNGPRGGWVVNGDRFTFSSDSQLVMWVPSDVRDVLLRPPNIAIISTQGSVTLHFANAQIGDSWTRCYQSS